MTDGLNTLRAVFTEMYGVAPRLFRAPGRVNLIGEHTDYNDGFVLPMAIQRSTTMAAAKRTDRTVRIYSLNLDQRAEFDLDYPGQRKRGVWSDYVEGVAQALLRRGAVLSGADLAVWSEVSIGGGLSSSAALEMSLGGALLGLSGATMDRISLALAGQEAEHTYVGINSGIMDQFVAVMGQAAHALLIDCRSLEGRLVPLNLADSVIVICDTRVRHRLASSEYNARRAECERGVSLLREQLPSIKSLRDVTIDDLNEHQRRLPPTVLRRCRHVVSENERTLSAARSLEAGNVEEMGRLMLESHFSLRDDYDVSCRELDTIVAIAESVPGVWGARMTGGGFGGCAIVLVQAGSAREFTAKVEEEYALEFGQAPGVFIAESADGASEITG
jgi:galactokinase